MTKGMQTDQRTVTAAQLSRLEDWANRKPCIALMGEFSAGKSTLINFLVGEDVLPTRVTATQLPPVWLSHGEPSAYYVDSLGRRHDLAFDDIHSVPVQGVRYIRLFCRGRILEMVDLIDTPGISDPNIPRRIWEIAVGYANAILWCTHSTQAWRQSERSAWESLPERVRANGVLLATRSDKLSPSDRERVAQRLNREASGYFRKIVMFSATDAIKAATEGETGTLWHTSGGAELLAALQEIADDIALQRKDMLSRYAVNTGEASPAQNRRQPDDATLPAANEDSAPALRIAPKRVAPSAASMEKTNDSRTRLSRTEADTMRSRMLKEVAPANDQGTGPLLLLTPITTAKPASETPENEDLLADDLPMETASGGPIRTEQTGEAEDATPEDGGLSRMVSEAIASVAMAEPPAEPAPTSWDSVSCVEQETTPAEKVLLGSDASVLDLWRSLVARSPRVETVSDILTLIEEFLAASSKEGQRGNFRRVEDREGGGGDRSELVL
ncbi:dynamin family protein [Ostreiculturibacter nitratireducens]|uniref:dynamin family protein n=1 Tax=Ostreiculturibacter nitratireducens TaxID=3075226 RepID=UPI0031B62FA9